MMIPFLLAAALASGAPPDSLPPILPGLGTYSRDIGSPSQRAQTYFDQGLALLYGFNHAEAARAFRAAAALDTTAAMPHWGLAMVFSPYLDRPRNAKLDEQAKAALERAVTLKAKPADRALIEAAHARFTAGETAYIGALEAALGTRPKDPEIAALLAEAHMLQTFRKYWQSDGSPAGRNAEARDILAKAIERQPDHLGLNHLYVHMHEAAHDPRPALASARRLRTLAPGAGHLLHMSSHIDYRVGDYAAAVQANQRARVADSIYFAIAKPPTTSAYVSGYHLHTLHFLWVALATDGQRHAALRAAQELAARAAAAAEKSVYHQPWAQAPLLVHLRFGDWQAIQDYPPPAREQRFAYGLWLHAAGIAAARRGRLETAGSHLAELNTMVTEFAPNQKVAPTAPARALISIAATVLASEIEERSGRSDRAVELLQSAVLQQDSLGHMEPPPWYIPVRQQLGALLLRIGHAAEAEAVYRADLAIHPDNGWSLRGLASALKLQGKDQDADQTAQHAARAFVRADSF